MMKTHAIILFVVIAIVLQIVNAKRVKQELNDRPIIGILSQPVKNDTSKSYIVAAYVKWIESQGGRVVPILHNSTQEELQYIFSSVNGIIFTGGGQYLKSGTPYFDAAEFLFNLTIQANAQGDYFPLWGTCMGFQLLHILVSGLGDEQYILEPSDSWDISYALNISRAAGDFSRMFNPSTTPRVVIETLAKREVTMNYHRWAVTPTKFYELEKLYNFFTILSVNEDNQGKTFISTVEAKNFPIYATQWHPEIPMFEFGRSKADHSAESYLANSHQAFFFVNEARKNNHRFPSPDAEKAALIYNFAPTFTENINNNEQTYYF